MFFKMAINNVKRSVRDYTIYFLTLTLAVCIFYSFNSIEAQSAIVEMGKSTAAYMETVFKLIEGISVFVSVILGALIIYANQFLIKKRKKELGLYMTLGMSKRKISMLLIVETLVIGVFSLVVGIVLGLLTSQGLSVGTAQLLNTDIEEYRFIFSASAMMKTALYFSVIYIVVMLFNQLTISKYKLIDLLYASKKNETVKLKNRFVTISLFVISIIILAIAYARFIANGFDSSNNALIITVCLGIIGTLLFFVSLSSFVMQVVQRSKSIYFKGINMFILRQLNYKMNTNFFTMTLICLMLFLTISLLFTMIGNKLATDSIVEENTPVSASTWIEQPEGEQSLTMEQYLHEINFAFRDEDDAVSFQLYHLAETPEQLFKTNATDVPDDYRYQYEQPVLAVTLSDYNEILAQQGKASMTLADNEVAIISNSGHYIEQLVKDNTLQLSGTSYNIVGEPIKENIMTTAFFTEFLYVLVPNRFSGALTPSASAVNIMFDDAKSEERFTELFASYEQNRQLANSDTSYFVLGYTVDEVHVRTYGMTATLVFLGVYLGLIFLISSAAVLGLQLLSDASDSIARYEALRKIGVSQSLINSAILRQNSIYFFVPLSLALVHSAVGIAVVNDTFSSHLPNILGPSLLIIGAVLVIIYGGYFYATYRSYQYIVRGNM